MPDVSDTSWTRDTAAIADDELFANAGLSENTSRKNAAAVVNENHANKISHHALRLENVRKSIAKPAKSATDQWVRFTKHEKCTIHKCSMDEFVVFGVGIIIVIRDIFTIRSCGFRLSANTATGGDSFVDGSAVEKAFKGGQKAHSGNACSWPVLQNRLERMSVGDVRAKFGISFQPPVTIEIVKFKVTRALRSHPRLQLLNARTSKISRSISHASHLNCLSPPALQFGCFRIYF